MIHYAAHQLHHLKCRIGIDDLFLHRREIFHQHAVLVFYFTDKVRLCIHTATREHTICAHHLIERYIRYAQCHRWVFIHPAYDTAFMRKIHKCIYTYLLQYVQRRIVDRHCQRLFHCYFSLRSVFVRIVRMGHCREHLRVGRYHAAWRKAIVYRKAVQQRLYSRAHLSFGIDVYVVVLEEVMIYTAHPCFHLARKRVHSHKARLQYHLGILYRIYRAHCGVLIVVLVPGKYFHFYRYAHRGHCLRLIHAIQRPEILVAL